MPDTFSNVSNDQPSPISLREYGDVLRRRRAIILQTFVIVLVAGVLVTLFQPNVYHASGRLLLDPPSYIISSENSSDPLADLMRAGGAYSIPTQVELLQTAEIRKEVQDHLNGQPMPNLTITPVEGTSIIQIDSEGENQESVANAPNELMKIYQSESYDKAGEAVTGALDFANKGATDAQTKLDKAEKQLRDFKQLHNIQQLQASQTAQANLVAGLSGDFDVVSQQLQVLQAKMSATRTAMTETGATKNDLTSPFEDPAMQAVENEIASVGIQLSSLVGHDGGFNEADPSVIRLRYQQKALRDRETVLKKQFDARNSHRNPIYAGLEQGLFQDQIQASELAVKAGILRSQLSAAKARLANFPNWEAAYSKLERDDAGAKANLALFSSKVTDLGLRKLTQRKGTTIMENATVPQVPIRPKKAQSIIIGGLLGLFLGLCLALLQELFDDRINNPEEAERVLRVPTLGHIPLIEEEGLRLIRDISTFSPLMEAYRSLRTNINFAAVGTDLRSLVITSSVPAEGKSTTVANLAMAMALDNKQVIVVDADLRRPSLHKLFKKDASPGLTDLLVGTHTVDEVIQDTNVPGVRVISAGSPPPNPAELLGSVAMGHVLEVLEASCDVVLFDSPPTLAVADAVVLASRTDGVALLVGYGETKKTSSKKAIEILSRANANLLGVVLNRIEGPSSGYYYGKYYIPATDRVASRGTGQNINRSFNVPPPGSVSAADMRRVNAPVDADTEEETETPALPENTQENENR